uniref:PH domain-containing protein n=1 Tax=Panagrellus redivivus TaxID=6233 RepID=A0A7E4US93_PANRE
MRPLIHNVIDELLDLIFKLSDKIEAGARSYVDYLRQIGDRIKQYTDFFKEIIKYSARAQTSTKSMQKALELLQSIPKRAEDVAFTDNILNYPGDKTRLGRLHRHDLFQVWEGDEPVTDRYIFLFNNKLMITDKDDKPVPAVYNHYATIRLDKYTVRTFTADEDVIFLRPNEPGLPTFRIKAKDMASQEFVRKAWLKDILDMQELYCAANGGYSKDTNRSRASKLKLNLEEGVKQDEPISASQGEKSRPSREVR